MDLGLRDQTVFISGSSRGIGRAIADRFLSEGSRVTVTGRTAASLTETRDNLAAEHGPDQVFSFLGDLTTGAVIEAALTAADTHWGGLDHVVANLGDGRSIDGWQIGDAEWSRMMNLNFDSAVGLIEAAVPRLADRESATITVIGSIAGREALGAPLAYSSAKAALHAYTAALSRTLGPDGIRVNCVAPGNILVPGGSWEATLASDRQGVESYIATDVPLRRFGRPEEIADLTAFLASSRASFITGACLVADGGQTRGLY